MVSGEVEGSCASDSTGEVGHAVAKTYELVMAGRGAWSSLALAASTGELGVGASRAGLAAEIAFT